MRSQPAPEAPTTLLDELISDVCAGLAGPGQKRLPSRYLYDDLGTALFEAIGYLPEYGVTRADERLLLLFLGSTIGNFEPPEAREFLREVRGRLRPGDGFLLGTDLVKPAATLIAAYDDALGVTAAFDLNLLRRLNRDLDAEFDLENFYHE